MKTKPVALMFSMALGIATCPATNVGLSTIEQPVNLGAESDPARIPLGAVATESNYRLFQSQQRRRPGNQRPVLRQTRLHDLRF